MAAESPRSASRKARQAKCLTLEELEMREENSVKPTKKELGKGTYGRVYKLQGHVVKEITFPKYSPAHILEAHKQNFEKEVAIWKELSAIKELRPYLTHFCGAEVRTETYYDAHRRKHETQKGYIIQLEENVVDLFDVIDVHIKDNAMMPFEYGYAIFTNLIKGYEIMRAAGYLHRDIKPENILIRQDKSSLYHKFPIFIDFGTVCKLPCNEKRLVGTPGYVPSNWHANVPGERRVFKGKTKKLIIKPRDNILPPVYSKHSDNYALSIVLTNLFYLIDWTGHDAERAVAIQDIEMRRRGILPELAATAARLRKVMAAPAPVLAAPAAPLFGSFFGVPPATVAPLVHAGKGTKRRRSGSKSASAAPNNDVVNALLAMREGREKRARSRSASAPRPVLDLSKST